MLTKNELKLWLRSGSLRFARHGNAGGISAIHWGGHAVYYRQGSSDPHVIHSILLKRGRKAEYWIPKPIQPLTILDIGGNIGAVALFFAHQYPEARIYTFEPMPSNFEILGRNIAPYPNIRGFNVALGAEDGNVDLIESPGKITSAAFPSIKGEQTRRVGNLLSAVVQSMACSMNSGWRHRI